MYFQEFFQNLCTSNMLSLQFPERVKSDQLFLDLTDPSASTS